MDAIKPSAQPVAIHFSGSQNDLSSNTTVKSRFRSLWTNLPVVVPSLFNLLAGADLIACEKTCHVWSKTLHSSALEALWRTNCLRFAPESQQIDDFYSRIGDIRSLSPEEGLKAQTWRQAFTHMYHRTRTSYLPSISLHGDSEALQLEESGLDEAYSALNSLEEKAGFCLKHYNFMKRKNAEKQNKSALFYSDITVRSCFRWLEEYCEIHDVKTEDELENFEPSTICDLLKSNVALRVRVISGLCFDECALRLLKAYLIGGDILSTELGFPGRRGLPENFLQQETAVDVIELYILGHAIATNSDNHINFTFAAQCFSNMWRCCVVRLFASACGDNDQELNESKQMFCKPTLWVYLRGVLQGGIFRSVQYQARILVGLLQLEALLRIGCAELPVSDMQRQLVVVSAYLQTAAYIYTFVNAWFYMAEAAIPQRISLVLAQVDRLLKFPEPRLPISCQDSSILDSIDPAREHELARKYWPELLATIALDNKPNYLTPVAMRPDPSAFITAIKNKQWNEAHDLAKRCPDFLHVAPEAGNLMNILHIAANAGDLETVRFLIEVCGMDVNDKAQFSDYTALHAAIRGDDHARIVVEYLLEQKADIEARSRLLQQTPLHSAAIRSSAKVFKLLLERGANRHAVNVHGATPADLLSDEASRALAKLSSKVKHPRRIAAAAKRKITKRPFA